MIIFWDYIIKYFYHTACPKNTKVNLAVSLSVPKKLSALCQILELKILQRLNLFSTVTFGTITNIPVTFYSSMNLSFVVPNTLIPGTYSVQVVNNNYPTNQYSNTVNYTIN